MQIDTLDIVILDISKELKLSSGGVLSYRPDGKKIKERIIAEISNSKDFCYINLNFKGIEICDISVVDEVVLEIMLHLRNNRTNSVIYLSNIYDYVYDNIEAAQLLKEKKLSLQAKEKIKLPLLVYNQIKGLEILGDVETVLEEAFDIIKSNRVVTAREISGLKGIAINSASNRLKKLYDYGLVFRNSSYDESGKYYEYILPVIISSP
ncbi:helix-turn-helix transcriptional regulator [Paenibacillus sp. 23TSA30-6]|uniref:helix-turn-helix transcriptional regulator n=1 Tax=Paenibacillus sp. 23TSA30-6 TaxID=2546104 RepID=UPI001787C40F|nr:helix-turn-helix transcriptional regulator [Paenibacillus sp. 23TSA30-6]MBE0338712.1 hypothetical protein [Paenibacillus sp. 23TSA30-6]